MALETALPLQFDRGFNPKMAGDFAKGIEDSGVVDYVLCWDQFNGWWTRVLWQPENTPWADIMEDNDSAPDAFITAAFAAAATSKLGVAISTDAIRRGPGELAQTMLTLAAATEGRAICMVGAGELRQAKPFGWKRSQGLQRLEDLLQIWKLMRETKAPIDFEGHFWTLQNAWLGAARPYEPRWFAMGGGPKLMSLAAQYADGFATGARHAFPTPERYAEAVAAVKVELERHDRNPDEFTFGLWNTCFIEDDQDVIDRALDNPLIQWLAAFAGRLDQADWELEGVEPVMPKGWHYALKLNPLEVTAEEMKGYLSKVTRRMVERSYFFGSAKEVADQLQPYVDAGATFMEVQDVAPMLKPVEEAPAALVRSFDVCRILKEQDPSN